MFRGPIVPLPALVLVLSAMLAGCSDMSAPGGPVSKSLRKQIFERQQTTIEISGFTPFPWDELHLFGPYTPRADVCRRISLAELKCRTAMPFEAVPEAEVLLVFRNQGEMIYLEPHPRANGDFVPLDYPQPLTRAAAVFVVEPGGKDGGGETWYRLRPRKP